jgi:hypothetical protein
MNNNTTPSQVTTQVWTLVWSVLTAMEWLAKRDPQSVGRIRITVTQSEPEDRPQFYTAAIQWPDRRETVWDMTKYDEEIRVQAHSYDSNGDPEDTWQSIFVTDGDGLSHATYEELRTRLRYLVGVVLYEG